MWPYVNTVSVLIGAIIVSLEIKSSLSDVTQPADKKNDASTDDNNQNGDISINVLESWKEKEPLLIWEVYGKEIDRNTDATGLGRKPMYLDGMENPEYNNRRMDSDSVSDASAFSKGGEIVESWFDLSTDNKKKKKKKTRTRTRTKTTEAPETTMTTTTTTTENPWKYRWGNKRREMVYGASSNIRRPIRVPFNSWGGKRGKEYLKRSKLPTYHRYDRDLSANGYQVKREMADFEKMKWKTPFNSWGGKRADKSIDRERYLPLTENHPDDEPILGVFKEYGFIKGKNSGNNNDRFLDRISFRVYNETGENNSMTSNDDDRRLSSTSNKRVDYHDHKICRKAMFDPWHGKRSFPPHATRFGRKDVTLISFSSLGKKIFLCCYPID